MSLPIDRLTRNQCRDLHTIISQLSVPVLDEQTMRLWENARKAKLGSLTAQINNSKDRLPIMDMDTATGGRVIARQKKTKQAKQTKQARSKSRRRSKSTRRRKK
jgi:hypothetical protein